MTTPHINARKDDFSDVILMPGDPLRAKYIAKNWLQNSLQINNIRGMLGFTGYYKDYKISVMGHGIGMPSCSLYVKELITEYNVKKIIRIGTCGAVSNSINIKDILISLGACTDSKINRNRFKNHDFAAIADFDMVCNLVTAAKKLNTKVHIGNFFSSDLFYMTDNTIFDLMKKYNILGIDMESAGLYGTAAAYGAQAVCICTVSDHIIKHKNLDYTQRQTALNKMINIALESIKLN